MTRSLPFTITEINGGFSEAEGLMHLEEQTLTLEFEVKDAIIGAITSDVQVVKLPLASLDTAEYRTNIFSTKIHLRAMRLQTFADVPGHKRGELTLHIPRKNKEAAQEFCKLLKHYLHTVH